jgi:hypothetical protein
LGYRIHIAKARDQSLELIRTSGNISFGFKIRLLGLVLKPVESFLFMLPEPHVLPLSISDRVFACVSPDRDVVFPESIHPVDYRGRYFHFIRAFLTPKLDSAALRIIGSPSGGSSPNNSSVSSHWTRMLLPRGLRSLQSSFGFYNYPVSGPSI